MRRIVILGTGTGVGKTHVSLALGRALATRPLPSGRTPRVALIKPIETGFVDGDSSDAARLAAENRGLRAPSPHPLYRYPEPISPHLAARRTARPIDVQSIAAWLAAWERPHASDTEAVAVIETAGGTFTPLGDTFTNFDLARALEPALWVLVAPDALGVLHDLTATLTALAARRRRPDHVVLSAAREPDASTGTNADELRRLGLADPLAVLARDAYDLSPCLARLLTPAVPAP